MKKQRKFTISAKLWLGFGTMAFIVLLSTGITYFTLNKNISLNDKVIKVSYPSSAAVSKLDMLITNSLMLVKTWVYIDKQDDTPDKRKLKYLLNKEYPKLKKELLNIAQKWENEKRDSLNNILTTIEDTLFPKYSYIMNSLNSFEKYDDPMVMFEVQPMVESGGDVVVTANKTLAKIKSLKKKIDDIAIQQANKMQASFDKFKSFLFFVSIIIIILTFLIAIFTIRIIVIPINYIKDVALKMAKGILPDKEVKINNNDEIGEMAKAFNQLINSLKHKAIFAQEIGSGNLDVDFTPASEQDVLGNSLIEMRKSLKEAAEAEKERKEEERRQKWAAEGLAMFSNILRKNNNDIQKLYDDALSNLVKYVGAIQGGLFILNDDDPEDVYLEMVSAYAYDRKKFVNKKIKLGEGLVGACAIERLPIYIDNIPEGYVKIASGLGEREPKYILLVPIKLEEKVFGVIELGSFEQFEQYKLEFIEKVGETIAATLNVVKINIKTAQLLSQSQEQTEELKAQEEEMRQNMEELQATQEEAVRRERELSNIIKAIDVSFIRIEVDTNRKITLVNKKFTELLTYTPDEIIGKDFAYILREDALPEFDSLWQEIKEGKDKSFVFDVVTKFGALVESYFVFSPIKNELGDIEKIIVFQNPII